MGQRLPSAKSPENRRFAKGTPLRALPMDRSAAAAPVPERAALDATEAVRTTRKSKDAIVARVRGGWLFDLDLTRCPTTSPTLNGTRRKPLGLPKRSLQPARLGCFGWAD